MFVSALKISYLMILKTNLQHMFFSKTDYCSMTHRPSSQVQSFAKILNSINILENEVGILDNINIKEKKYSIMDQVKFVEEDH